jgi:hypothetical protein
MVDAPDDELLRISVDFDFDDPSVTIAVRGRAGILDRPVEGGRIDGLGSPYFDTPGRPSWIEPDPVDLSMRLAGSRQISSRGQSIPAIPV